MSESSDFISKFNKFETRHRAFISVVIKPIFVIITFLAVGYYTLWMESTYLRQDKFQTYLDKQENFLQTQFELTQSKLENIMQTQLVYAEQLKGYNTVVSGLQKQLDQISERTTYLERYYKNYPPQHP